MQKGLSEWLYNQTHIKVLGTDEGRKLIKVVTFKTKIHQTGLEDDYEPVYKPERGSVNDCKLEVNLCRTKSKIFELAICNPWDYYFTGTLNPQKYDRTNLDLFHKTLTQWLRDYGKLHGIKIDYLLIPELHSDGQSWHMHGFIRGLSVELLHQFRVGDKMGKALAEKVKRGDLVFNWQAYSDKFGFCDLEPIRDEVAVSKYVTKYITKDLQKSVKELNAHQYYHSRGLKTAQLIKKGTMFANIVPQFENEYIKTATFEYSDELLALLLEKFY